MKILGIANPKSGCGYHRVSLPLGFMDDIKGVVTNKVTPEQLAEGFDIIFYNRLSMFDNNFEDFKREYGYKFVMDMDDDWILPTNHLNYYEYLDYKPRIENNLRSADLVTCTNQKLADKIKPFNENVVVVPNALPYGFDQFVNNKIQSDKIRIFWCGGITHEGDLETLRNPIKRLSAHKEKIEMVIGGYDTSNNSSKWLWDKMVGYFTSSCRLPHQKLLSLPPNQYMSMYDNADIMLIPLMESEWSSCKSNLKLLEAASRECAVICQAVEPYINDYDAPVLWVYKQSDWFKHLNYLINNPEKIKEYGQKTKEWANRKYNIADHNKTRRAAFANLIKA